MNQHNEPSAESPLPLQSLEKMLAPLTDQRAPRGVRYGLLPLLCIVLLAKLTGADTPVAIADWAAERAAWLRAQLHLNWRRMPHHSTYRRLFQQALPRAAFEQQASLFLSARQTADEPLCNLDGKTMRGTIPSGATQGLHLLALQQAGTNLVLAQQPVATKQNEISSAPALLKTVDLQGKIVSGDAMHAQRALSRQIVKDCGDYLWFVKNNQPALCQQLAQALADPTQRPSDAVTAQAYDKGHGRIEFRQLTSSAQLTNALDWPYAAQAFVLRRERTDCRTDKVTSQTVYGITSLVPFTADAPRLLHLTRQHWSVENGLHYRRDVTFGEDRCRMKSRPAAECLAIINNLVIGLLRWLGWDNLARARRYYAAHLSQTLQLIQGVQRVRP
jgi:predicted transposase YbfD/YdcC